MAEDKFRDPSDRRGQGVFASAGDKSFFSGCVGKIGYPSKKIAKSGAKRLCRYDHYTVNTSKPFVNVYKCKPCGKWHVGHSRTESNRTVGD